MRLRNNGTICWTRAYNMLDSRYMSTKACNVNTSPFFLSIGSIWCDDVMVR